MTARGLIRSSVIADGTGVPLTIRIFHKVSFSFSERHPYLCHVSLPINLPIYLSALTTIYLPLLFSKGIDGSYIISFDIRKTIHIKVSVYRYGWFIYLFIHVIHLFIVHRIFRVRLPQRSHLYFFFLSLLQKIQMINNRFGIGFLRRTKWLLRTEETSPAGS